MVFNRNYSIHELWPFLSNLIVKVIYSPIVVVETKKEFQNMSSQLSLNIQGLQYRLCKNCICKVFQSIAKVTIDVKSILI